MRRQLPKSGSYNLWAVFKPAEGVPGEWTAHCLDIDLVSQGRSLRHAMDMLAEAVLICLLDDIQEGFDLLERPRAPQPCWEELEEILHCGEHVSGPDALPVADCRVATQLRLHVKVDRLQLPATPTQRAALAGTSGLHPALQPPDDLGMDYMPTLWASDGSCGHRT